MKMELPELRADNEADDRALRLLDVQAVALDEGVLLKRGLTRVRLEAEDLAPALDALIDGARAEGGTTRGALMATAGAAHAETMGALIDALLERRLLVPANGASSHGGHEEVFYWNYGGGADEVRRKLSERRIAVIGVNHIGTALVAALSGLGFTALAHVDHPLFRNLTLAGSPNAVPFDAWQDADDMPDCIVLTSDVGGPDLARDWNRFCVEQDILFYPVLLQDQVGLIGPMVMPGTTACYECFARREAAASPDSAINRATDETAFFAQTSFGFIAPMTQVAAGIAATELLKFFSQALPGGAVGRLVEADLLEPALTVRRVLKAPRCPVCGPVRTQATPTPEIAMFMPGND